MKVKSRLDFHAGGRVTKPIFINIIKTTDRTVGYLRNLKILNPSNTLVQLAILDVNSGKTIQEE